jgi:hypothetical protein
VHDFSYRFPTGLDGRIQAKMSMLSQLSASVSAPQPTGTMTISTPGLNLISPYELQNYYEGLKQAELDAKEAALKKLAEKEAKKVRVPYSICFLYISSLNFIM